MEKTNGVVELSLTNTEKVALIDAEDFERVSQYKWYYHTRKRYSVLTEAIFATGAINNRKVYEIARFILDAKPGQLVDHKNRNRLHNYKSNLRICTAQQNAFNRAPKSGRRYKGFRRLERKKGVRYSSQIVHNGKQIYLGLFRTIKEAARAYDEKAKELFGEFAWLNFPEEI